MASAEKYLPPPMSEEAIGALLDSVGVPRASTVRPLSVGGQFHSIYRLSWNDAITVTGFAGKQLHVSELILRVSGNHYPQIKTINEIASMHWVYENTAIPIPHVIAYDAQSNNPLGHEYTLVERMEGTPLSEIYQTLAPEKLDGIVAWFATNLAQLHSHRFSHIGGLSRAHSGEPGPILEETFWQEPEVQMFWPGSESLKTLNIQGHFASYTEYIIAQLRQYQYAVATHSSLEWMKEMMPRIDRFISALEANAKDLDKVPLIFTHRDLLLQNILYDTETDRITAILDWEFALVIPATLWTKGNSFMHPGEMGEAATNFRLNMLRLLQEKSKSVEGGEWLEEANPTPQQQAMQRAADYLRAIVEVCPRGQNTGQTESWKASLVQCIETFGV